MHWSQQGDSLQPISAVVLGNKNNLGKLGEEMKHKMFT